MFHWHKWKIIMKEILPSFIEQIGPARVKAVTGAGKNAPQYKACIVTYRCECGAEKVKRV